MQLGACRRADNNLFFPGPAGKIAAENRERALLFCEACGVVDDCLAYALDHFTATTDYGIWGGTTAAQRVQLRQERIGAAS